MLAQKNKQRRVAETAATDNNKSILFRLPSDLLHLALNFLDTRTIRHVWPRLAKKTADKPVAITSWTVDQADAIKVQHHELKTVFQPSQPAKIRHLSLDHLPQLYTAMDQCSEVGLDGLRSLVVNDTAESTAILGYLFPTQEAAQRVDSLILRTIQGEVCGIGEFLDWCRRNEHQGPWRAIGLVNNWIESNVPDADVNETDDPDAAKAPDVRFREQSAEFVEYIESLPEKSRPKHLELDTSFSAWSKLLPLLPRLEVLRVRDMCDIYHDDDNFVGTSEALFRVTAWPTTLRDLQLTTCWELQYLSELRCLEVLRIDTFAGDSKEFGIPLAELAKLCKGWPRLRKCRVPVFAAHTRGFFAASADFLAPELEWLDMVTAADSQDAEWNMDVMEGLQLILGQNRKLQTIGLDLMIGSSGMPSFAQATSSWLMFHRLALNMTDELVGRDDLLPQIIRSQTRLEDLTLYHFRGINDAFFAAFGQSEPTATAAVARHPLRQLRLVGCDVDVEESKTLQNFARDAPDLTHVNINIALDDKGHIIEGAGMTRLGFNPHHRSVTVQLPTEGVLSWLEHAQHLLQFRIAMKDRMPDSVVSRTSMSRPVDLYLPGHPTKWHKRYGHRPADDWPVEDVRHLWS